MTHFSHQTQTPVSGFNSDQFSVIKHSVRLLAKSLVLLPALLLSGCEQTSETAVQSTLETDKPTPNTESLWRYQNTRFGDPMGQTEPLTDPIATEDQLIAPIPRRSAHSQAAVTAKQINQQPASRQVTLAIKTDPTHGRYLTLTDPAASFACQPSCELRARFDVADSQVFRFESSDPHQLFLLKDTQANRLVDQIKTAKSLQLSIPTQSQNPEHIRYTFEVGGLDLSQIAL